MTVREASKIARVSEGIVRAWIAAGLLAHFRMGRPGCRGTIRIAEADLQAFMTSLRQEGARTPPPPRRQVKLAILKLS